jgi:hypothetical protein
VIPHDFALPAGAAQMEAPVPGLLMPMLVLGQNGALLEPELDHQGLLAV